MAGSGHERLPSGTVVSVRAGRAAQVSHRGRAITTAIGKRSIAGTATVLMEGIVGDEQADRRVHGGLDKAVCVYPLEHYAHWEPLLGRDPSVLGLGENLTTQGLLETEVCLGDRLTIGDVEFEIGTPRRPCFKLGVFLDEPQLPVWFQETGRTGFYLRTVKPGILRAGDEITVTSRRPGAVTVSDVNDVMNVDRRNRDKILRLLNEPGIPESWADKLRRRLESRPEDDSSRLYG